MGYFSEQLKKYLSTATLKQLEDDYKLLEEYNSVGPLVEDYFDYLDRIPQMRIKTKIESRTYSGLYF